MCYLTAYVQAFQDLHFASSHAAPDFAQLHRLPREAGSGHLLSPLVFAAMIRP
jgi:hypothetical protein